MAKPQSAQDERGARRPPRGFISSRPSIEDAAAFIGVLRDALGGGRRRRGAASAQARGRARPDQPHQDARPYRAAEGRSAAARRPCRDRGPRRRRRRAPDRDRSVLGGGRKPQARAHRRMWRHEQPRRCDARRRTRRGLRDVRRAQSRRLSPVVRDDYRTHRVVGRTFRPFPASALRRPRTRSARWWPRAPISSRSATASGTIRAAPRQPSRRPRGSLLRRSPRHERPASCPSRFCRCRCSASPPRRSPNRPRQTGSATTSLPPPPASRILPTRNTSAATTSRRSKRRRGGLRRKAIRRP